MNIIEKYKKSLADIYAHVGFKEDWVVFPVDDKTMMVWDTDGETVKYAFNKEGYDSDGNCYSEDVYKQRFYDKYIYEGERYTMIFCDPHTDGMQWFRIFDNEKRIYHER